MDTFVENTGVAAEQEKQDQSLSKENGKQIQIPNENLETAGDPLTESSLPEEDLNQQIKIVRTEEKPDPLGRNAANSPLNEIKAGYDYAFGKNRTKG